MRIPHFIVGAAVALSTSALVAQAPVVRAEDQAVYERDMAEWQATFDANQEANRLNADLAAKQRRAYADAMHAWRIQVIDCKRGIIAACRAPTPRPADFMQ